VARISYDILRANWKARLTCNFSCLETSQGYTGSHVHCISGNISATPATVQDSDIVTTRH